MVRTRKAARINWYILLFCALVFATAGTLFGAGAIIFSGHVAVWAISMVFSIAFYVLSFQALCAMERC